MKKDKILNFKVSYGQMILAKKILKKVKERDRFTYGEILVQALELREKVKK